MIIHSYNDHVRLLLPNLRSSMQQSLIAPRQSKHCYEIKWISSGLPTIHPERYKAPCSELNAFYKKGCQEKSSPSTGRREDFCLEIQPTACERAPRFAREVRCGLFAISAAFS